MKARLIVAMLALAVASPALAQSRAVTIPAGTQLRIALDSRVASDTSRIEDRVSGHLAAPIVVNGRTVVPTGSAVGGVVTDVKQSGKVKGRARVGLRFNRLTAADDETTYRISTRTWTREAPGTKEKDAAKIAIPAAGGAVVGGLIGGKKGAAIGAAAGGGGGTAVVLATRGKEVRLGPGNVLFVRLSQPLTIRTGYGEDR